MKPLRGNRQLGAVTFLQPGVEFRGRAVNRITAQLDKVEILATQFGIEVMDEGICHWFPLSMCRQAVVLRPEVFPCPVCGEEFEHACGLATHHRWKHGRQMGNSPKPPIPIKPKAAVNG